VGAKLFGNLEKTSFICAKIHNMTQNNTDIQSMHLDITENLSTSLEVECAKAGTNFTEVCKDAGINRSTVQRWKDKEPKTFIEIRKILQAIHNRRAKKNS
jgi:hypothetical protein